VGANNRRKRKTYGQLAQELFEGINPKNMNDSIRKAERLLSELDPASPDWEETYQYLEAMARYRDDIRGD